MQSQCNWQNMHKQKSKGPYMKKLIARILIPLSLTVLLLAGAATAQYEQRTFKVSTPFEFSVNDKVFPAGDYTVVRATPSRVELRDSQGRVLASVITHSVESQTAPRFSKLAFSTADGGHALTQIWLENERVGYELASPKTATIAARRQSHGTAPVTRGGN